MGVNAADMEYFVSVQAIPLLNIKITKITKSCFEKKKKYFSICRQFRRVNNVFYLFAQIFLINMLEEIHC
jgi:hypothetical protein